MKLFKGIFGKRPAASPREATSSTAPAAPFDAPPDESLVALSRELSALAKVHVPPAAKERGWAALQRELERRPVRAANGATTTPATAKAGVGRTMARPRHSRGWRWAIGTAAAAAVAVIVTLVATYGGGGAPQVVSTDDHPTTSVTSVVTTETTQPSTTGSTGGSSTNTTVPDSSTTGGGSSNTGGSVTTSVPATGPSSPPSSSGSTGTTATPTTQPASTTTTNERQNTASQREASAENAVRYLADLVIRGNTSGARALIAPEAQPSLAQMVMSLEAPVAYGDVEAGTPSGDIVHVTLGIVDRVSNGQGELEQTIKQFIVTVRVDSAGAVVTGINGV